MNESPESIRESSLKFVQKVKTSNSAFIARDKGLIRIKPNDDIFEGYDLYARYIKWYDVRSIVL